MKTDLECICGFSGTQPEKPAVIHENDVIDYGTLWRLIGGFASYLTENGFQKNEAVILKCKRSSTHVVAYYAIQLAGGIPVILSESMTEDSVLAVAQQYDVKWIITNNGILQDGICVISHGDVINISTEFCSPPPLLSFFGRYFRGVVFIGYYGKIKRRNDYA